MSITWTLSNIYAPKGCLFALGKIRDDRTAKVCDLSDGVKNETVTPVPRSVQGYIGSLLSKCSLSLTFASCFHCFDFRCSII